MVFKIPPLLLGQGTELRGTNRCLESRALGQAPCSGFISVAMTKHPDQKQHGKRTWLAISHHSPSQSLVREEPDAGSASCSTQHHLQLRNSTPATVEQNHSGCCLPASRQTYSTSSQQLKIACLGNAAAHSGLGPSYITYQPGPPQLPTDIPQNNLIWIILKLRFSSQIFPARVKLTTLIKTLSYPNTRVPPPLWYLRASSREPLPPIQISR